MNSSDPRIEKHFLLPGINNNPLLTMNDILIVQDIIEKEYYSEELKNDKQLREIISFLRNKGFTEKYTWLELENLINEIKD
jgi:hypothetical protein